MSVCFKTGVFFVYISMTESNQGSSVNFPQSENYSNSYMQQGHQDIAAFTVFYYVKSRQSYFSCAVHRNRATEKWTHFAKLAMEPDTVQADLN